MAPVSAGLKQPVCAAIALMWGDHEVFGLELTEQQVNSRHAARRDDRTRPTLYLGKRFAQEVAARLARTDIIIAIVQIIAVEGVGAGQIQRWQIGRASSRERVCQ